MAQYCSTHLPFCDENRKSRGIRCSQIMTKVLLNLLLHSIQFHYHHVCHDIILLFNESLYSEIIQPFCTIITWAEYHYYATLSGVHNDNYDTRIQYVDRIFSNLLFNSYSFNIVILTFNDNNYTRPLFSLSVHTCTGG